MEIFSRHHFKERSSFPVVMYLMKVCWWFVCVMAMSDAVMSIPGIDNQISYIRVIRMA